MVKPGGAFAPPSGVKVDLNEAKQQINFTAAAFATSATTLVTQTSNMMRAFSDAQAIVRRFADALRNADQSKVNLNVQVVVNGSTAEVRLLPPRGGPSGSLRGSGGSRRLE